MVAVLSFHSTVVCSSIPGVPNGTPCVILVLNVLFSSSMPSCKATILTAGGSLQGNKMIRTRLPAKNPVALQSSLRQAESRVHVRAGALLMLSSPSHDSWAEITGGERERRSLNSKRGMQLGVLVFLHVAALQVARKRSAVEGPLTFLPGLEYQQAGE